MGAATLVCSLAPQYNSLQPFSAPLACAYFLPVSSRAVLPCAGGGLSAMVARGEIIGRLASRLKALADTHSTAVLVTNQASEGRGDGQPSSFKYCI